MGYQLIETVEVGAGGASSIEFTGIPQDGVDLVLKISQRNVDNAGELRIQINADTSTSNYPGIYLEGNGSSAYSYSLTSNAWIRLRPNQSSHTANTFSNNELYFANYTSTGDKSVSIDAVMENNATTAYQELVAATYKGSLGISSFTITASSGNLAEYSTASLYKITAD